MKGDPGVQGVAGKDGTIPIGAAPPVNCEATTAGRLYVDTAQGYQLFYCDGASWAPSLSRKGPQASISTNGLYCGKSLDPTTGNVSYKGLVGYRGVKAMCEDACGNRFAHICTNDEISRSYQVGALSGYPTETLWYSTWVRADYAATSTDDCDGWQCGQAGREPCSTELGPTLRNVSRLLNTFTCTNNFRVACCL